MEISKIYSRDALLPELSHLDKGGPERSAETFRSVLEKSVKEVNEMLLGADEKNVELAVGKAENLHEATIAIEKAETALKLLVQVRNKALEAYHEIMRMQV